MVDEQIGNSPEKRWRDRNPGKSIRVFTVLQVWPGSTRSNWVNAWLNFRVLEPKAFLHISRKI